MGGKEEEEGPKEVVAGLGGPLDEGEALLGGPAEGGGGAVEAGHEALDLAGGADVAQVVVRKAHDLVRQAHLQSSPPILLA